jgi:hypothetical protein
VKSWKTTAAGIVAGLSILLAQASTLLDDDAKTNPSFSEIIAALGMLGIGYFARDNGVTSKAAGAER